MKYNIREFLDRKNFRNDPLASVDSTCEVATESSLVTLNPDCVIDIRKLCNGIMNCADCADETEETCYSIDCAGSKYTPIYFKGK